MNPDTSIRSWLLACGKQYGINQAHDYRWHDSDAREKEYYFTYQILGYEPAQDAVQDISERNDDLVSPRAWQEWIVTVQVDLHNSEDGMYELASCAVALRHNRSLKALFDAQSCGFYHVEPPAITNMSTWNDERITYHHRMVIRFTEHVQYQFDDTASGEAVVEQVRIGMTFGGEDWDIAAGNVELQADPETLVLSGTATLTEGS